MNIENLKPEYAHLYEEGSTDEEALRRLMEIIKVLRGKDGCPWDREQTHESLKVCMIEEAYEVCDAIDKENPDFIKDELGDVLLQVVFHSDIEREYDNFSFKDVANAVSEKMVRRHPHIFWGENAKSVDKALERWENVKRRERDDMTLSDIMSDIPKALPALTKSYKVQVKAAEVGFDWDDVDEAFKKVSEEKSELIHAMKDGSKTDMEDELGDLLFSVVNIARFLDINPENALNGTSQKFIDRFSYIEKTATQRKLNLVDMSLEAMDALWEEAKRLDNSKAPDSEVPD